MASFVDIQMVQLHPSQDNADKPPIPPRVITQTQFKVWLTPTIIIILAITFLACCFVNNCPLKQATAKSKEHGNGTVETTKCFPQFMGRLSLQNDSSTYFGFDSDTLQIMGGYIGDDVSKEPWRILTAVWLTQGIVSLVANLLILGIAGWILERQFGAVKIGTIYIISGIGSIMLVHALDNGEIAVACLPGPVFGLVGAMAGELIVNWSVTEDKAARTAILDGLLFIYGFLLPGHSMVGGTLVGFLLAFIIFRITAEVGSGGETPEPSDRQFLLGMVAAALLIAYFLILAKKMLM